MERITRKKGVHRGVTHPYAHPFSGISQIGWGVTPEPQGLPARRAAAHGTAEATFLG